MRTRRLLMAAVATLLILAASGPRVIAATFQIDASHSAIGFKIRHLVGRVPGQFGEFSGTIEMDPDDPAGGSVEVVIQASSIDTRNQDRDNHLRNEDFFHVDQYPTITFRSTQVTGSGDRLRVVGDLTMHGVTRPVTLDTQILGVAPDPWGNLRAGFEATTTIDRKEFGIVWNKTLDAGGLLLGKAVEVTLSIEAVAKPSEAGGGSR
jgi:polyisoprenoid-binding protein YceI